MTSDVQLDAEAAATEWGRASGGAVGNMAQLQRGQRQNQPLDPWVMMQSDSKILYAPTRLANSQGHFQLPGTQRQHGQGTRLHQHRGLGEEHEVFNLWSCYCCLSSKNC